MVIEKECCSTPTQDSTVDMVNQPSHYASRTYEVIDVMKDTQTFERHIGYLEGCVLKYMMRWDKKANHLEDLKKARWYLNRLIQTIEGGTPHVMARNQGSITSNHQL